MKVRTRFSPSPTGMIHLGNGRAALYSALFAKQQEGVFILRIEDTDAVRSEERHVESLQEDLQWLGIDWQEGPVVGGAYGPYWQSQRQDNYAKYYKILEEQQLIYPCFCSDQELMLARKLQLSRSQAPRYSGTCRKLSKQEIEKRIAEGKKPAWRFIVPADTTIEFVDVVKGPQSFQSNDIGDFIVRRADGTAPFLFCNAIDDAMMEVSHVLRGEDHLANTPRQLMLLRTLALSTPSYGHLSLIVGADGAPLSKRHGSFSLDEMRKQGYLPIAVMNYLVRLGHTCDTPDLLDFEHLASHFQIEKLSRSPARFDKAQLLYWQKIAVQKLDIPSLWQWLGEELVNQVPESQRLMFAETVKANIEFPQDAMLWSKVFFDDVLLIDTEQLPILSETVEQFFVEALRGVDKYGIELLRILEDMKQNLGLNGKKLFMPLRVALTGKTYGPELVQIAALLGKEKIKQRLNSASQLAANGRVSYVKNS
jgi:glutamyl-tRNA synthetase